MGRSKIGLDIGTSAVRAAELNATRDGFELIRIGQLSLPEGAVVEGEIQDAAAVAEVIKELWNNVGFSSRSAVLGINSQKLVVRTIEIPELEDPEDVESTVRFEALEQIAIPLEEAILDYELIGRIEVEGEEDARLKVLVAAAPLELVYPYLSVAKMAGIHIEALDPTPFALVRGLHPHKDGGNHQEAIVSLGSALTSVIVHQDGEPQFVRVLRNGTSDIRRTLSETHDIDPDMAEAVKRAISTGDPKSVDPEVIDTLNRAISPLVEEVRGSIDYYSALSEHNKLTRVLICGGGSRVRGIGDRLKRELNVDVDPAHPFMLANVGKTIGFDNDTLAFLEPLFASTVGHGLWGLELEKGARRVNLLPDSERMSGARRRQTKLVAASLMFVALALGVGWALAHQRVVSVNAKIAEQQKQFNVWNTKASALGSIEKMQQQRDAGRRTKSQLLKNDVSWTKMMRELAATMPANVRLTTFQAQVGNPSNMTVIAAGRSEHDAADWLSGLASLPWSSEGWISNTQRKPDSGTIEFNSNAVLNPSGQSPRYLEASAEEQQR